MRMDAIDAYKTYVALKNHFTQERYDYFKYNKKANVSYDSFLKRKDKFFFAKLGSKKDAYLEDFLVSNFIQDTKIWVGELLSDESELKYREWKKRQESLTYVFKSEIEFMSDIENESEFNSLFDLQKDNHPAIIRMYLRKELSIETLIILNSVLNFMTRYDSKILDPLYKEVSKLCRKYQPFLKYDRLIMKTLLKERMTM